MTVTNFLAMSSSFLLLSYFVEGVLSVSKLPHASSNYDEVCVSIDYYQEYKMKNIVKIDPTLSNGSSDCYPVSHSLTGSTVTNCSDINAALTFHKNSTAFILASGPNITHYLQEDFNNTFFEELSEIAFIGDNASDNAQVECLPGAGLGFWNVDQIQIQNIEFSYCGALRDSTSRNFSITDEFFPIQIVVGLFFYNCTDVTFCQVTVQHGLNSVGVVMYDVDGIVNVYDSNFINNTFGNSTGGGGFILEFSYCVPSHQACNDASHQTSHNSNSNYTFYNSSFRHNKAKATETSRILSSKENHIGFGIGAGLSIIFKSNAMNNSIQIITCQFIENEAMLGAGLYVMFQDISMGNQVNVERSFFNENKCDYLSNYGTGGGMRVSSLLSVGPGSFVDKSLEGNCVRIVACHFVHNNALQGGALAFSPTFQTILSIEQTTSMQIESSYFLDNIGRSGAAIYLHLKNLLSNGIISPVSIRNCTIQNNTISYAPEKSNYDIGIGVIYSFRVSLNFTSISSFSDNYGSALAIVETHADFCDSNVSFVNNKGDTGGALALLGDSHVLVNDDTEMYFAHNSAREGGAIYNHNIAQRSLKADFGCFIQYYDLFANRNEWGASFTFFNNTSIGMPTSTIFSTSVFPCALNNIDAGVPLAETLLFCNNSHWNFVDSNCTDEIKTQGNLYKFHNTSKIESFPGEIFILPISVLDDLDHNITKSTSYTPTILSSSNNVRVDPKFSLISENYLVITGQENVTTSLGLESTGSRPHFLQVEITLKKCPPGFYINSDPSLNSSGKGDHKSICHCHANSFRSYLNCSILNYRAQIPRNFWIGEDPTGLRKGELVMAELPNLYSEQYFNNSEDSCVLPRSYNTSKFDEMVCGVRNRSGPICGRCKKGYSTAVNSYDYACTPCDKSINLVKNIILFLVFAYLPYLFLFGVIIIFNLKLTSSAVNGFVLFAQMVSLEIFSISGNAYTKYDTTNQQKSYLFIYGVFNLKSFADVMQPFCISRNFNTLDVLCLEYTLAGLPLMIILMIYLITKLRWIKCACCRRPRIYMETSVSTGLLSHRRRQKSSSSMMIHALASFILLSYTKFSTVSMKTLSTQKFFDEKGISLGEVRLLLAGHLSFASRAYLIPYGVVAILIMVIFVLLPPLFLLGLPQLVDRLLDKERFARFRRIWPTLSIHAFLDAFQGYHKPNRRIFAGLYFGFRLCIVVSYVATTNYLTQYIVQQILITVMIALIAIFKPYKREIFNFVDILIFLNLAIINSITTKVYGYSLYVEGLSRSVFWGLYYTQYCLIWLPLIYMLCYIIFKLLVKTGLYDLVYIATKTRFGNLKSNMEDSVDRGGDQMEIEDDSFSDAALFRRAEDENKFRSVAQFGTKRGRKGNLTLVGVIDGEDEKK